MTPEQKAQFDSLGMKLGVAAKLDMFNFADKKEKHSMHMSIFEDIIADFNKLKKMMGYDDINWAERELVDSESVPQNGKES